MTSKKEAPSKLVLASIRLGLHPGTVLAVSQQAPHPPRVKP